MKKILILTAGYGEGHNSAARALQSAFHEQPGVDAELVDLFALRAPRLNHLSRRAYLRLINSAPGTWSRIYRWLDRSTHAPLLFRAFASHRRMLGRIVAEKRPVALCSTYPVYGWLLEQLRREGREIPPLYTVVTDAITINSLWYRAPADGWFVTDDDSAAYLRHQGVPAEKVFVSGFPVALAYADRSPFCEPTDPSVAARPKVLFMINSGRRHALDIARALLMHANWHVTFTAGRDEGLRAELAELAQGAPATTEVLGWTERIPELLMTHHVVISKAGGATTQESINALCPLLVSQVVPGQEEGNYELIRRHETGARAESPQEIVSTLQRLFASDAGLWRHWRANLLNLARPSAARDIAATVLTNCTAGSLTPPTSDGGVSDPARQVGTNPLLPAGRG